MMLNSAPVRATAFMKLTRLTSMKPLWPVRIATCERKGGSAASELPALRADFVSGMSAHASAALRTPATA